MKNCKILWKSLMTVCAMMLLVVGIVTLKPADTVAASDSMKVISWNTEKPQTAGKYYFKVKYDNNKYVVRMSTKKSSGYKKIKLEAPLLVDGKTAYGIKGKSLCKMNLKTQEYTTLKSLSSYLKPTDGESPYMNIVSGEYGYIYINWSSFPLWSNRTYVYNIKAKSMKVLKNTNLDVRNGDYVTSMDEYRSDVSPYSITLWKYTKNGLKKVKKLTSAGRSVTKVGKYYYYADYPTKKNGYTSMQQADVIRVKKDGTGKKNLGTIKTSNAYGEVIPYDFTSDHCSVRIQGELYKFTYKTQKLTKQ